MMLPIIFIKTSRFFTSNITVKLLSLAVALSIWSFTAVSREINYDLVLPVELRNIPSGYKISGNQPREIHFTLHGSSLMIDGARRSNSTIILNLRGASAGRSHYAHLASYLKLPEGIKVTRISPATMEIELIREPVSSPQGDPQE
jgi:hypothetical protein